MDYISLNEVTTTLIGIIQTAVDATEDWSGLLVLPEVLKGENEGIGFYLYHVQENGHYKNYPAPGKDQPSVSYTPMALNLFYQLSPNKRTEENADAIEDQRLMSVAMKALHDNAVVTKTIISATNPTEKKVNLKITLQNISPSESVQYWAAGESSVRLSAYYEVSVVFLQPEITSSYAGRVLSYGNFIFVRGTPHIVSSQNTIEYILPGELSPRQVKIQPAQAPPVGPSGPTIDSVISFIGTGYRGGEVELLLINAQWDEPAVVDPVEWQLTLVSENQLNITVQETASLLNSLPGTPPVDIIPGLYAAQITVTELKTLPDLSSKEFRHTSNQFPFLVMPRINSITPTSGTGTDTITVSGYRFQHDDITAEDIQVYIGENRLRAEQFRIAAFDTLELILPVGLPPGPLPIRIMVKGVESAPRWIEFT